MNNIPADPRPIQDGGCFDVIVVGGGIAGISAAAAAARTGAEVLLLEKNILLGGLATVGLISWYEPLCDGEGRKMTGGIAEELIRLAIRYGPNNLPQVWRTDAAWGRKNSRYASFFSPTIFALALNEYMEKNNVKVLLDVLASYPVMEGKLCRGIVVQAEEGRIFFGAKVVIDATGNAGILRAGNVPTVDGENFLSYVAHTADLNDLKALEEEAEKMDPEKPVKEEYLLGLRNWKWSGYTLAEGGHPENMPHYAGVTSFEVTEYVRSGQRMMFEEVKKRPVGSYEILTLPCMPQLRTCRRLDGEYVFTAGGEQKFDDAIGACGDFRTCGRRWQLPYRILFHSDFSNLLAAGRIVSAEGDGWEVTRVIPVCALTGQAAGTAAAIAAAEGCGVQQVDIRRLQRQLCRENVILEWKS